MKKFIIKLSMIWKEEKYFLAFVFIIAFLLRLFYILTLKEQFYFDDPYQWDAMARNFLFGRGLIISENQLAFRMPLYPIFLSVVYFIFGHSLLAVRIFQSIISSLTCVLIYFIGKEVFSKRIGKIASVLCAIYLFFIYYSGAILTETLYILLLALMVLFLVKRKFILAGIFLGLATLCRAEISLFIIFIFLGLFLILPWKKALKSCLLVLIPFLIILSPWMVRNYFVFHKFVPFSTIGGYAFWEGNNPQNDTGGPCSYFPAPEKGEVDEIAYDQYLKKKTIKVIKDNPGRFIRLCGKKFFRFWNIRLNTDDPRYASRRNNLLSMLSFGPVLILFLISLFISFWNRESLIFFYFLIFYVMCTNLAFVSSLRYRLPIEPYLIILASYPLSILFKGKGK